MSWLEENKMTALRWFALLDAHRIEELCAMTAPTWLMRGGPAGLPPGPDGLRELFRRAGPIDQHWTIEDVIAEGDKVVVRATNTCLEESFLGIPARGRWQTFTATFIHRIAGGTILETWRTADDLGRVLQLGARVEPPQSDVQMSQGSSRADGMPGSGKQEDKR
jgi:hypothetical protein